MSTQRFSRRTLRRALWGAFFITVVLPMVAITLSLVGGALPHG